MKMKLPVIAIAKHRFIINAKGAKVMASYSMRLEMFPLIAVVRISVIANQKGP